MLRRDVALVLGLVSMAIIISSIFIYSTLTATDALPLTYDAMIRKTYDLPEVKAFLEQHPQADMNYADKMSQSGIGYVNYRVGGERGMNELELEVLVNRTSGEVVQTSIVCYATTYDRGGYSPDDSRSFNYTNADIDIAEFVEQGRGDICGVPNKFNQ